MRKFRMLASAAAVLLVMMTSPVQADHVAVAHGTGSQEVTDPRGGVETDGTCQLYLELVPMVEIQYKLECWNLTGVTQAHIHVGKAQANGGVVAFLFGLTDPTGEINGTLSEGTIEGADIVMEGVQLGDLMNMIRTDEAYVNVHTAANPPGEVRGQITGRVNDGNVVSDLFFASGTGSQEIVGDPPNMDGVTTDGTCFAHFRVTGAQDDGLKYRLKCWNLTGVTQAHIHMGSAEENGPVVAFLFPLGDPIGEVNGLIKRGDDSSKGTLRDGDLVNALAGMTIADLLALMRADNAYLNVHTAENMPGEVRGQITLVDKIGF